MYWEYELGGFTYKTIIECKDHKNPVKLGIIDEIIGKTHDLPELKPIIATKSRYQSGVPKKAIQNGIELLIVREQNNSDWINEYGIPLTKTLVIIIKSYTTTRITKLDILYDEKWVKENRPDIDITKPFQIGAFDKEVFIDDISNKEKYSINDLIIKLASQEEDKFGDYEKVKEFNEAYILHRENRIKVKLIRVFFCIPEPVENKITIDYSQELIGVVEYLNRGIKKKIFKNGNIDQEKLALKTPKKHQKKA